MASRVSVTFCAMSIWYRNIFVHAFESDIISDITSSNGDERRALNIKAEQFWQPVLEAATRAKLDEHLPVYEQVDAAIASFPDDVNGIRAMLSKALEHLRRADETLVLQGVASAELASEQLAAKPVDDGFISFLTGGQNLLALAIKRFVGGGQYSERLVNHLRGRQVAILPALRGVADATGDVLHDCRRATELGFDVLKHEDFVLGKSSEFRAAEAAADLLITAAEETRERYMDLVMKAVNSLTKDVRERRDDPSAIVTRSLLSGMHESLKVANVQNDVKSGLRLV
eukprot:TRINITY_DN43328_c0_g1_i1.p1 TRINITY_DN43328_c0_g1~~TRINITY_DN43328_c0_g1_i1.p1  ORF type:complete len:317 (+),score=59.97 TRINITY_DN43328_c0_g1_i1:95-952(+)